MNFNSCPIDYPIVDRAFYFNHSVRSKLKSLPAYKSALSRIEKHKKDPAYFNIWVIYKKICNSILTNRIFTNKQEIAISLIKLFESGVPYHIMSLGVKLSITVWKLKLEVGGKDARVVRKLIKEGLYLVHILFKSKTNSSAKSIAYPELSVGVPNDDDCLTAVIDCSKTPTHSAIGVHITYKSIDIGITESRVFENSSEGEELALIKALETISVISPRKALIVTDSLSAFLSFSNLTDSINVSDMFITIVLSDRISTYAADRLACSFSF